MKRIAISGMLLSAGLLVATAAQAAMVWTTSSVKIVKYDIEAAATDTAPGLIWLTFNTTPVTTNCDLRTSGWWLVGGDPATVEALRTAALAGKLADLPIKVGWMNGNVGTTSCSQGGLAGYPVLRGIQIL